MENEEPGILERARRFVEEDIWRWEPQPSSWTAWAVRPLQLSVLLGEGFLFIGRKRECSIQIG